MKKKSVHQVTPTHTFQDNELRLSWPNASKAADGQAPSLAIPLGAWLDGHPIAFRKWAVRQKGVQSRSQRGRGFVAVDYRKPVFHWRGKVGEPAPCDLQYLRDVDFAGWDLMHPGLSGERVKIEADTEWTQRVGMNEKAGPGYPEPRYWFLRHRASGVGVAISCAGPGCFDGVELSIRAGRLSLTFLSNEFEPSGWNFPDFYLSPGVSTLAEAEAEHIRIVAKEGFVRSRERGRRWWRLPTLYVPNTALKAMKPLAGEAARKQIFEALDALAERAGRPKSAISENADAEKAPTEKNGAKLRGAILALDTAWADAEADWNPECPLFADFEEFIAFRDALHEQGHAILLTLSPFKIGAGSTLFEESPWLVLKDKTGLPATDSNSDYFYDHTHLETRPLMDDQVEFFLGGGEEQLGVDGVVLAPGSGPANAEAAWNDPARGAGERLWRRVISALAEKAREIRPDALIEIEAAEAFVQGSADRVAPLGLLGRRAASSVVESLDQATPPPSARLRALGDYRQPIPGVEGVDLLDENEDFASSRNEKAYRGVVFAPKLEGEEPV